MLTYVKDPGKTGGCMKPERDGKEKALFFVGAGEHVSMPETGLPEKLSYSGNLRW